VIEGVGDLGVLGAAGFWVLTFGLGEETGWRGVLQHQLDAREANRNNALIVGLIWAGWHLPFFFYDANYMAMGPVMIFGWFMGIMAGAVFLAWLYHGARESILAVIVWHALFDLSNGAATGADLLAPLLSMLVIAAAIVIRNVQARGARVKAA
jgi:membrane protease YdiL (CAAX protease family)